jgi:hypothetical protein
MTRMTLGLALAAVAALTTFSMGCAEETASGEQRVRVVRNPETAAETGGIPPDKQADIQLLLQQREPSVRKCYNDVLNEKHDRAFKGTVILLLTVGTSEKGSAKIIGGTLNNADVGNCLVEKLGEFEYPKLQNEGTMQYVYKFEPAY